LDYCEKNEKLTFTTEEKDDYKKFLEKHIFPDLHFYMNGGDINGRTSDLEAFHSLVSNKYCKKLYYYSFKSYTLRLNLAILDYMSKFEVDPSLRRKKLIEKYLNKY
jgi:hypothetical protein